nr:protein cordon-bleu-like [Aotus nancymaae]
MEAIHSAGGKDSLRKTAEHTTEGRPAKLSYMEAEGERSALLAAIRGHSGACSLRKVSSSASEELRSFRDAALCAQGLESPPPEDFGLPPPPAVPPPPPPPSQGLCTPRTASRFSMGTLGNSADARQALMDAIRSGTGAARLRKVTATVHVHFCGARGVEGQCRSRDTPACGQEPWGGSDVSGVGESQSHCIPHMY